MSISQVIGWKFNNQAGMSTKDGVITEFPNGIPTQADQDLWTSEYEAHLASTEYARARAAEYSALNQFEMQFDDQQNNTTTWVDAINDIKARFPK
jgi:hypothetical protein